MYLNIVIFNESYVLKQSRLSRPSKLLFRAIESWPFMSVVSASTAEVIVSKNVSLRIVEFGVPFLLTRKTAYQVDTSSCEGCQIRSIKNTAANKTPDNLLFEQVTSGVLLKLITNNTTTRRKCWLLLSTKWRVPKHPTASILRKTDQLTKRSSFVSEVQKSLRVSGSTNIRKAMFLFVPVDSRHSIEKTEKIF